MKKFPAPVSPMHHSHTHTHSASCLPTAHWVQIAVGGETGRPYRCGTLAMGKGRTGPSFSSCSLLLSGTDLQIPPQEFGSFTMGPPAQGLTDIRLETPFLRFLPAPKSTPRQVGWGLRCPTTSAPFGSGQLPAPIQTRVPGQGQPVRPRRTGRRAACAAADSRAASPPRLQRGQGVPAR